MYPAAMANVPASIIRYDRNSFFVFALNILNDSNFGFEFYSVFFFYCLGNFVGKSVNFFAGGFAEVYNDECLVFGCANFAFVCTFKSA